MLASGTTSVSPQRWLKRRATSRCQFEVLALIVAHRHPFGVVGENVGGHQHRVVEQADAHRLLALRLLLELGHAAQLAEGGDAVEQPGELGVLVDVALHEEGAALGSSPAASSSIACDGSLRRRWRVPRQGEAVEVDDAVQRLVGGERVLLRGHPVLHRVEIVPQMDLARGLDAREQAQGGHGA